VNNVLVIKKQMSIVFTWACDMHAFLVSVTLTFSTACFGISFPDRTESTMIITHDNSIQKVVSFSQLTTEIRTNMKSPLFLVIRQN
jgi:hypothetical protein